jgi:hypothetical protein
MGIKVQPVATAAEAFETLASFLRPNSEIVFRGHKQADWRLESTLSRHVRQGARTELSIRGMDDMLQHFLASLASVGRLPQHPMDRRTKLEYGRHHGVPSPLIDFSRSPYVSLWMAFDGVRPWEAGSTAVYALDVDALGILWQKFVREGTAFQEFRWNEHK